MLNQVAVFQTARARAGQEDPGPGNSGPGNSGPGNSGPQSHGTPDELDTASRAHVTRYARASR
jgi:hypothetical protein